ncbi:DUF2339 domain-containing protein [Tateyamaria sp. SN3-11]|uniref:DUF2339 domain-containing protein n=1 Tax=Tateyamaria sp. SN3-11 TaxID=3092147 RepID=UPI0039E74F6D
MEAMLVLLGVVVLAIPVAVIYLLVSQSGLRTRVSTLESELAQLRSGPTPTAEPAKAPPAKDAPWQTQAEAKPKETPKPAPAAARVIANRQAEVAKAPPAEPSALARLIPWLMANWFYAVSAVSLALAGLFLVQYGVENGLFPPTARVLAALGFGGALIVGGEVIRRRFGDTPEHSTAYLPSVFSGAGLVSLFGGVAAAHLLYDLVGPEAAFIGMAAVGVIGVVLGWLHGPLLATIGVVGAFAAPFLVSTTVPASAWLYLYFAVITALGLGIDTLRRWAWVSALSVGLGFAAGWAVVQGGGVDLTLGFQAHVMVMAVLAILIPARSFWPDHGGVMLSRWVVRIKGDRPGFPTYLAAASVALASIGLAWTSVIGTEQFWMAILSLVILTAALALWSVSARALQDLAILPALALGVSVVLEGVQGGPVVRAFADAYAQNPEANFPIAVSVLWGIGLGLSLMAAGRAMRDGATLAWTIAAALIAPVMAVALEVTWAPAKVIGAYPWALHAMVMAAVMVGLALRFAQADKADKTRASLFVLSALAAITFGLVLILSLAALTVALAVTVLVAALLDRRFDLPLMQIFITIGVAAVGTRLIADPGLGWALDAPLWEMLLAYAGALGAFCASLWALRGKGRPTAQLMLDTAAWSTGGVLVSLLLFRALDALLGEDGTFSHWGFGLYAVIWLGLMLAQLVRLERLSGLLNWVRMALAAVFGLIGFGALAVALTLLSPLLTGWGPDVAGPPLLNTLLVAYLLPAAVLALAAYRLRHPIVRRAFGGAAAALAVFWAFMALRHLWQGPDGMELSDGFLQGELYSYTVALLIAGAALFYQSLARNSVPLRRAGLVVIGLAVAKVFLIDISGLDGLTRVLSLVVLGLSLAALAWLNRWAQGKAAAEG